VWWGEDIQMPLVWEAICVRDRCQKSTPEAGWRQSQSHTVVGGRFLKTKTVGGRRRLLGFDKYEMRVVMHKIRDSIVMLKIS